MTKLETGSLDSYQRILIVGMIICVTALIICIGVLFAHYEGYFCKPVEQNGNTVKINAWCGHNGMLIEKNGKTFWQVNGTNFGDGFP